MHHHGTASTAVGPTMAVNLAGSTPKDGSTLAALFGGWTVAQSVVIIASASVLAIALGVVIFRRVKATRETSRRKFSAGTLAAVAAFVICTSVSLNTSYRFTADGLGMTGETERLLSCAAFESLIAMCVLGARERMDGDTKSPGWYGSAVWVFAALSSVPAWHEGGGFTTGTLVRVIVGSFGSALAAHSALGLELRHRTGADSQSPMAQIARDLRERLMARLGLAHRGRTAQQIAQARALDRAVDLADEYERLSEDEKGKRKGARLAKRAGRSQDRAGIATDDEQKRIYRSRVAQRKFSTALHIAEAESPWHTVDTSEETEAIVAELEIRIRHMESLAAEIEAAVAAHAFAHCGADGTQTGDEQAGPADEDQAAMARRAAAAHQGREQVTVRVPHQQGPAVDEDQAETEEQAEAMPDLNALPTKRAKLEALYVVRISDDDARTNNAIAEELLAELAEAGITLDRGAANRYVGDLRKPPHPAQEQDQGEAAEAHEAEKAEELVSA